MDHTETIETIEEEHKEHPIAIYLWVWLLLFVFSACSYAVDYFQFQGGLRWTLILLFMFLKAGAIIAIFMHMTWERLALSCAILLPPIALLVFVTLMALESNYTFFSRLTFLTAGG
jgi:cytochrome c oxidase subunit 4